MAQTDPSIRRGAARSRAIGLSFAVAVHGVVLAALAWGVRYETEAPPGPPVDVQLIRMWPNAPQHAARRIPPTPPTTAPRNPPALASATAGAAPPGGLAAVQPDKAQIPAGPLAWPSPGDAHLGLALRGSLVGCANPDAARLSQAEREACGRRLAKGAADTPYIPGISPRKRAYYETLAASEEAMERNPMGGHAAGVICKAGARNVGFKLGPLPCSFVLSPSPYTPEADVPAP